MKNITWTKDWAASVPYLREILDEPSKYMDGAEHMHGLIDGALSDLRGCWDQDQLDAILGFKADTLADLWPHAAEYYKAVAADVLAGVVHGKVEVRHRRGLRFQDVVISNPESVRHPDVQ